MNPTKHALADPVFEQEFLELCRVYGDSDQSFGTEQKPIRKGVCFTILRRMIKLELLYVCASFGNVRNVIYCRVYPNKAMNVYYLMPELFEELGIEEFRSCIFAEIETEERLKSCFSQLTLLLNTHLPAIEAAAEAGRIPLNPEEAKTDTPEHRRVFSPYPEMRDRFVLCSYTLSPAYQALLLGDRQKAIRAFEKAKRRGGIFAYQERLCAYLKTCDASFSPMPDACNAVKSEHLLRKRAVPVYFVSIAVLYAAFFLLFFLLRSAFLHVLTKECTAFFSSPWYDAFLLAGLPAMFGFFALRKRLAVLVSRKYGAAINRLDRMKNSRSLDRFTAVLFAASVAVSLFFFAQIYGYTVRIYPNRLDYAAEDSVLRREEIRFDEISAIYHVSARYNVYGDRVERASYVIVTVDGRHFDLDGFCSEKDCETVLFPLLADRDLSYMQADTEREIP